MNNKSRGLDGFHMCMCALSLIAEPIRKVFPAHLGYPVCANGYSYYLKRANAICK